MVVVTECDEGGHAARNHVTTTRALVFISLCKQLAILTAIKKSCKSSYDFSVFLPTVAEVAQAEVHWRARVKHGGQCRRR